MKGQNTSAWALFALFAASALVAGCLYEEAGYGRSDGPRWDRQWTNRSSNDSQGQGGFGFGNSTSEQRQERMQQRFQAAVQACQGKAQGDSCTVNFTGRFLRNGTQDSGIPNAPNDAVNRTVEGKCENTDGTLQCRPENRRPPD